MPPPSSCRGPLGCDAVRCCVRIPTLQRSMLPPSSRRLRLGLYEICSSDAHYTHSRAFLLVVLLTVNGVDGRQFLSHFKTQQDIRKRPVLWRDGIVSNRGMEVAQNRNSGFLSSLSPTSSTFSSSFLSLLIFFTIFLIILLFLQSSSSFSSSFDFS
jgi:hypothetical protein